MSENWERQVVEKTLLAAVVEQRRTRRWNIFFRLTWLVVIALVLWPLFASMSGDSTEALPGAGTRTAVLQLSGTIDGNNDTANRMIDGLKAAYKDSGTRGIIIRANSPGGSPVLSGMVYDEIMRQKKLHPKIPLYVVVEDVCASGCYYIAAAADKIFVDKASIVGSIGVLSDGFGFTGLMDKLGVERRLAHAGRDKGMGDPFSPETPEQRAIRQCLLDEIHTQFITAVKRGRGARLKGDELFTGRVWIGEQAIPLGLVDGYGSVNSVARDVIHAEDTVDMTPKDGLSDRIAKRFGVGVSAGLRDLIEARWL